MIINYLFFAFMPGTFCEQEIPPPNVTPCNSLPSGAQCGNNGRCFVSAREGSPMCYCPLGFIGETCGQSK